MEQTTRARNRKIVKILIASLVFLIIGFIVFLFVWITWFMPPASQPPRERLDMLKMGNIINVIDVDFRGIGRPECSPFSREEFQMGPFQEIFQGYGAGEPCWHWEMEFLIESSYNYVKDYHTMKTKDFIVARMGERILLISVGPDGVLTVGEDEVRELFENPPEGANSEFLSREERRLKFLSRLEPHVYRATNGTGSNGDIFRLVTPRE